MPSLMSKISNELTNLNFIYFSSNNEEEEKQNALQNKNDGAGQKIAVSVID